MNCRTNLALIALALAGGVSTSSAQSLLYSNDFSSPIPPPTIGYATSAVSNQQLVLTCTRTTATDTNNLVTSTGGCGPLTLFPSSVLPDQQTLELRVDVVSANQDDAFADIHWYNNNNGGYFFVKDQNEIGLLKGWNNGMNWAFLFWTNVLVKNENVTLVLALTRVGSDLKITTRVLDKDSANAVLFERTTTDTPAADPALPNRTVKGILSYPDPAGTPYLLQSPSYAVVGIAWLNPQSAPNPLAQVIYDNMEVWQYQTPQLNIQNAVVLSWPVTAAQFVLESAPGVNGPWETVPDPWLRTNATQIEVSVPAPDSMRLFRLRFAP
jgi:hypothetical protein